jgi:hypothetical protein
VTVTNFKNKVRHPNSHQPSYLLTWPPQSEAVPQSARSIIESEGKFRMIISEKQQQANRQNAKHSTGPKSPEGKKAVRFNALTWSLRARSLMIGSDDPEDYQRLWDSLEAEWQPQTHSERYYLEQMAASQWSLTRTAASESRIYDANLQLEKQLALLDRVSTQRVRLERSFTAAMRELKQLQKERRAQPQQQPQPAPTVQAEPKVPLPSYVMSEGTEAHPVFCAPAATDTR